MKFRTTKKEIMRTGKPVICVGYDNLQHLLTYERPVAYTCGRDGWYSDIYDLPTCIICTGYQPFGTIRPPYELQRQYDIAAQSILYTHPDYEETAINSLLNDFVKAVLNNE